MKYFLLFSLITLLPQGFAAEGKHKVNRKPANSSTIECAAFSLDGYIKKLELGDGNNPINSGVRLNGQTLNVKECAQNDCYFRSGEKFHASFDDKELSFQIKFGKILAKVAGGRGDYEVNEITVNALHDGSQIKMYGICSGYNY